VGVSADASNKFRFTVDSNAPLRRYSQAGITRAKRADSPREVPNVLSADKKSSIPLRAGMLLMFVGVSMPRSPLAAERASEPRQWQRYDADQWQRDHEHEAEKG